MSDNPNLVSDEEVARRKFIPDNLFYEILNWSIVPTVDFIVTRLRPDGKKEFLLALRKEEPFKGTWFVPGGRILRGERISSALARQLKRELGIDIETCKVVSHGTVEVLNPPSEGGRPEWHSIWNLHEVQVPEGAEPRPLAENAKVKWFTEIDRDFPAPVIEALTKMGFDLGNA